MAKHPKTFRIGGELEINRLGFGAMRITGKGICGPPDDREGALATLRRLPELGVDFIDTANSYGPEVSEELIKEALYPYSQVTVATKGGLERSGARRLDAQRQPQPPGQRGARQPRAPGRRADRAVAAAPHRLEGAARRAVRRRQAAARRRRDRATPGLSEVSVEDIEAASKVFPVATVQNRYNFADRGSEDVLKYCEAHGIGFIPWFPLAAGELTREGSRARRDRQGPRRHAEPDRGRLAAAAQPGDHPDPGHVQGGAPGGEREGGRDRADGRRSSTRWIASGSSGRAGRVIPAGGCGIGVRHLVESRFGAAVSGDDLARSAKLPDTSGRLPDRDRDPGALAPDLSPPARRRSRPATAPE